MLSGTSTNKRPRILLVNPWIYDFAAFDLWARPLGLLVTASLLRDGGWEPVFVDCLDPDHPEMPAVKVGAHGQGRFHRTQVDTPDVLRGISRRFCRYGVTPEKIKKDLEAIPRPSAVLVTSLMTYWYPGVAETIKLIREIHPGVPILLGGIYASLMPDHAAAHCGADEVIRGPAETALSTSLFACTGIGLKETKDCRELRFSPALDLMSTVRFQPLLTSRGCPFRCVYCASEHIVPRFIRREPESVIREIEKTVEKYGVRDIALYDDAFLVDSRTHALPILEKAAQRVPGIRWHTPNGLHASAIDVQVAQALKKAGFETIRIGLESTSDRFHEKTGGKTNLIAFETAVKNLKEVGFSRENIGVYLLVGLPGQTKEQIEHDVDIVLGVGAIPKLAEYSPIPQTRIWPDALKTARFPISEEPLFHNCTLLSAADPGIDSEFLREMRGRIRSETEATRAVSIHGDMTEN